MLKPGSSRVTAADVPSGAEVLMPALGLAAVLIVVALRIADAERERADAQRDARITKDRLQLAEAEAEALRACLSQHDEAARGPRLGVILALAGMLFAVGLVIVSTAMMNATVSGSSWMFALGASASLLAVGVAAWAVEASHRVRKPSGGEAARTTGR